jgi:hypothetical protein
MKTTRTYFPIILAAAMALIPLHCALGDETSSQVAFSDPSKPGTLKIRIMHGDLTIHGADVKEVSVKSDCAPANPTPRKDGMRVLTSSSGFLLTEKDNVATLEYGSEGWTGGSADFDITVPRTTSIIVASTARGDFQCSDVSGDVDVRTMSGNVKLDGISGGALVETMNGEIDVRVKELAPARPLSFTSMHGEVTIRVPQDSKANVRFRTHRGVILTNFDDKALVTKTVVSHGRTRMELKSEKAKNKDQADAGPEIAEPAAPDAAAAPAIAKPEKPGHEDEDSDGDWHAEVRDSIRMAADEAAMAAREAAEAVHEGMAEFHAQMNGGAILPLPPMTGGKVVAGTLNGGGVEIQATTLSGDIVFKRSE